MRYSRQNKILESNPESTETQDHAGSTRACAVASNSSDHLEITSEAAR